MKIGDLSRATGVEVETIRYDEKAGHGEACACPAESPAA
jgi:hypothetical protein